MLAEAAQIRSTRETAPSYADAAMRNPTILLPLLFILADGIACKDDEPTGAEFGEPCGYDPETDKTIACAESLDCYVGYCEDKCDDVNDCRSVDGFMRECTDGLCNIVCNEADKSCPQTLDAALVCNIRWCAAVDGN